MDDKAIRLNIIGLSEDKIKKIEKADFLIIGDAKFTSRENAALIHNKLMKKNEKKYGVFRNVSKWITYPLILVGGVFIITLIAVHIFGGSLEYSVSHGVIESIKTILSNF